MDDLLRFLQNLLQISNSRLNQEYNNGRIIDRELLPELYRLLADDKEHIVVVMARKHGGGEEMPAWFRQWSENVYQRQQPKWFKDWNDKVFEPRMTGLEENQTKDHELLLKVIELNNLKTA